MATMALISMIGTCSENQNLFSLDQSSIWICYHPKDNFMLSTLSECQAMLSILSEFHPTLGEFTLGEM